MAALKIFVIYALLLVCIFAIFFILRDAIGNDYTSEHRLTDAFKALMKIVALSMCISAIFYFAGVRNTGYTYNSDTDSVFCENDTYYLNGNKDGDAFILKISKSEYDHLTNKRPFILCGDGMSKGLLLEKTLLSLSIEMGLLAICGLGWCISDQHNKRRK